MRFTEPFSTNPQFFLDLEDPDPLDDDDLCPIVVSLAQRQAKGRKNHNIGFKVFKVPADMKDKKRLDLQFFKRNSAVSESIL